MTYDDWQAARADERWADDGAACDAQVIHCAAAEVEGREVITCPNCSGDGCGLCYEAGVLTAEQWAMHLEALEDSRPAYEPANDEPEFPW